MDPIPTDLSSAALAARDRLTNDARRAAVAGANPAADRGAMATVAREAIFADALLSAMHARLEEVKNAAK